MSDETNDEEIKVTMWEFDAGHLQARPVSGRNPDLYGNAANMQTSAALNQAHRMLKDIMAKKTVSEMIEESADRAGGDFYRAAIYVGMTMEEFEGLVGTFRRGVEEGIRAARIRLMKELTRKGEK